MASARTKAIARSPLKTLAKNLWLMVSTLSKLPDMQVLELSG